jgi:hypothetical protein
MRIAQVTGMTGSGVVDAIHSSPSVADLEAFFSAMGIAARAIPAEDLRVQVGTAYDGNEFAFPTVPEVVDPITPEPPSVAEIVAQLDSLRRQAIDDYLSEWGLESKENLWPQLDAEIIRASGETAQTLVVDSYPSIAGFLEASGFDDSSPELILGTAAGLRANKKAHVALLRKTELIRNSLRNEYAELSDEDKLTWSAQTRWVETYGA